MRCFKCEKNTFLVLYQYIMLSWQRATKDKEKNIHATDVHVCSNEFILNQEKYHHW